MHRRAGLKCISTNSIEYKGMFSAAIAVRSIVKTLALVTASALIGFVALAEDKTSDPWKCPWREMKTHIPTPVPPETLRAYIAGQTIYSEQSNGIGGFFQYKADGSCFHPRFHPIS